MDKLVEENYIDNLRQEGVLVSIYLINGIKLNGLIANFNDSVLILTDTKSTISQLIYKHAISTIVPIK